MANFVCIKDPIAPAIDGVWFDLDIIDHDAISSGILIDAGEEVRYVPTAEFVTRKSDNAVAQVYVRDTQTEETK